jgi:uncharacterized membrane protein
MSDGAAVDTTDGPHRQETPETHTPDGERTRRATVVLLVKRLIQAIRDGDESMVEKAILGLSQRSRWLAPLALVVGAFAMLFQGVKLLVTNWRLTLVQVLPAMWIWLAMLDIKLHVFRGKEFHIIRGPLLVPALLAVASVTAASFYLNAVFAFAISKPGKPEIRPAFVQARGHLGTITSYGFVIGIALGVAALVTQRWGLFWFGLSLSVVVAVMMVAYVAVPSRLAGIKSDRSRKDKLTAAAVGGAIGATVCSPPFALGRVAILMLGVRVLFVPAIILLAIAVVLQTGATTATKAVKFSAKLVTRQEAVPGDSESGASSSLTVSEAVVPPSAPTITSEST